VFHRPTSWAYVGSLKKIEASDAPFCYVVEASTVKSCISVDMFVVTMLTEFGHCTSVGQMMHAKKQQV